MENTCNSRGKNYLECNKFGYSCICELPIRLSRSEYIIKFLLTDSSFMQSFSVGDVLNSKYLIAN